MYSTSKTCVTTRKEVFRLNELKEIPDSELKKYFLTKHVFLGTVYLLFDGPITSFWELPLVKETA